jgi:hypothetical protein
MSTGAKKRVNFLLVSFLHKLKKFPVLVKELENGFVLGFKGLVFLYEVG